MSAWAEAAPAALGPQARSESADCFHCGAPLGTRSYVAVIDGAARETCCPGCQSVAQLIAAQGLDAYYRQRAALPATPDPSAAARERYAQYDLPELQAAYVFSIGEHERETALLLEGVTCAACLWLIEQRLMRLDGVTSAVVNHGARRVRVRWDATRTRLSAILAAIAELGYGAHVYDARRSETVLLRERRTLLWRLFVAAFGMMQVMMYAYPAYISEGELPADLERLMQWAGLALTLPVMLVSAMPFYAGAWRALRARTLNMDVPVSIGILTAFAASVLATTQGMGAVYYDSICMLVFLLLGARFLELNARTHAAREHDRLARLAPAMAARLPRFPQTRDVETVAAVTLQPGDVVQIVPGAAVPGDGVVLEGVSSVNESLLTGESRPVAKQPGDRIIAGAVNGASVLIARLTHTGQHTAVAGIVRLMDRALEQKPRLAMLADRAASHFVFALLIVTALTAAAWWVIDRERVLWITISLLVVTCPCALSLATPAALVAATGALARRGVLITRGHALETLARVTHFVFDKTGTVTQGRMQLIGVLPLREGSRDRALAMAAALEAASEHPVGRALATHAAAVPLQARQVKVHTGQGVEGVIDGQPLRIGAPQFVAALHGQPLPPDLAFASDEVTTVALGDEKGWIALLTLGDTLRPEARRVLQTLSGQGCEVHLLSGDRAECAARIASRLGVDLVRGGATPADKLRYVRDLQNAGAVVAMTGDGVNDAPVLAQAQVSIAMASGTELARMNADVALLTDSLQPLLDSVAVARRTLRVIHQNFAWALLYNVIAVPLAVLGLITPWAAALGMSMSSLLVIANALRLYDQRPYGPPQD